MIDKDFIEFSEHHHEVKGDCKRKNHHWSFAELRYLKNQWENSGASVEEIAFNLDLKVSTVRAQIRAQGWKRRKHYRPVNHIEGKWYCTRCKEYKTLDNFYERRTRHKKYDCYCRDCSIEIQRLRREKGVEGNE